MTIYNTKSISIESTIKYLLIIVVVDIPFYMLGQTSKALNFVISLYTMYLGTKGVWLYKRLFSVRLCTRWDVNIVMILKDSRMINANMQFTYGRTNSTNPNK
jgi:hypothetical protein